MALFPPCTHNYRFDFEFPPTINMCAITHGEGLPSHGARRRAWVRAVDIVEDAGFTAVEAVNADQALSILEIAQSQQG